MHRSKKLAVLIAGAVAALAVGSFAFAGIPGSDGVIHACYEKDNGKLRVTDNVTNSPKGCTAKEIALDWNQRGPSNAYSADELNKVVPTNDGFATTLASTPDLPAGKYVVSAKLVVAAHGLNLAPTVVGCSLGVSNALGGTADYSYGTVSSNGSGNVLVSTLALENDNTADVAIGGGKAFVRCDGPVAFDARNIKITAIQVESLTY